MNKYYELPFGRLMEICEKVLALSINSRISIKDMNNIVIRLPMDTTKDYFDIGVDKSISSKFKGEVKL